MELSDIIKRCISIPDGQPLSGADADALRKCVKKYPHFTLAAVLLLRHQEAALEPDEIVELKNAVALSASDKRTLAFAAYGDDWAKFYPEAERAMPMPTFDVIDTFLRAYGNSSPEDVELLEKMIFNPTPDYAEILAREEQENLPSDDDFDADSQDARINAFIRSKHPATHRPELLPIDEMPQSPDTESAPVSKPDHSDDSLLSESLAKIFIKQRRYEKAFEIISQLNLKFPKKSAYFADQLRFLQILITNHRRLNDKKTSGDS